MGSGPTEYDGGVEEDFGANSARKNQGVREGLLQEEWPADTLGLCCCDGLCAWVCPQVAQPVHTGMNEWMDRN